MRKWIVGLVLVLVLGCDGGVAPMPDGQAACSSDEACDDGLFCNGVERCLPEAAEADAIGCVRGELPCLAGQRCDDAADECVSNCSVLPDADGDGVEAIACGGADCDDTNPNRYPGNVEVCDDANVDEDCDPTTFGQRDGDGDGYVDAACCNEDAAGAMRCGDDCSDHRRDMRPGFAETCDFLDNDCDGMVDEGVSLEGFADEDRDLHGDPSTPLTACPGTPGFALTDDDCDDADPEVHGAQLEICDSKDNDCDGMTDEARAAVTWYADEDDDGFGSPLGETRVSCEPIVGFSLRSSDCDDADRGRNPAARELCNGVDDDCNGRADFLVRPGNYEDDDGDGYADMACGGNDCDDANAAVRPGAQEICDGIDNDCDGIADGASAMALWYLDLDGDGFGDESMPGIESCTPQPARVPRGGDCDDADASVRPGVSDPCDGEDQDCDGATDEDSLRLAYYVDLDGDGYGDSASPIVFSCIPVTGRAYLPGDCDDGNATRYPAAMELCDLLDNDCDGDVDEEAPTTWYPDVDRDGHGVPGGSIVTCSPPAAYAPLMDDCDDGNASRFPGNAEVCDLVDNDCDTTVDEGAGAACVADNATGSCTSGVCSIASCTGAYRDCDGAFATGCEVNTANNPTHCGACGDACALGDTCGRVTAGTCDGSVIAAIRVGESHTLVRRSTGGVLAWGYNVYGQVGTGGTTNVPQATPLLTDIVDVSGGSNHSCAATAAGRALCWGYNPYGQLGDGTRTSRTGPGFVGGLMNVRQIEAGEEHTCALRTDGTVWCWGSRRFGQLGDGVIHSTSHLETPTMVPGITDALELEAGNYHTCVRRPLGGGGSRVQCWGRNQYGQLGVGTAGDATNNATPTDVIGLPSDVVAFAYGVGERTCARLSTGGMRCWGRNGYGANGNGTIDGSAAESTPQVVTDASGAEALGIVQACASLYLTCVLREGGAGGAYRVFCSGADDYGQLGDGNTTRTDRGRLQAVIHESGTGTFDDAVAIGCGRNHACAARADGSVWCWGNDVYENLGNGPGTSPNNNPTPLRVAGL